MVIFNLTMPLGDTRVIEVQVIELEQVVDITGSEIRYRVALGEGGTPLVGKSTDPFGGITITDGINGIFQIQIDPEDTEDMDPRVYRHEAQMIEPDGRTSTVMTGQLVLLPSTARQEVP